MTSVAKLVILCVDDEPGAVSLLRDFLDNVYEVVTAESGDQALQAVRQAKPDLILLDIMMPGMDGFAVCARLQEDDSTAQIPVIFVTGPGGEQDKARALASGGVDCLVKPVEQQVLLDTIQAHLRTSLQWQALSKQGGSRTDEIQPADFVRFKAFLAKQLRLTPEKKAAVSKASPAKLYAMAPGLGIDNQRLSRYIAEFLQLPYLPRINQEAIRPGVLPASFCRTRQVVAVRDASGENAFVLSDPFDWELLDALQQCAGPDQPPRLLITEPATISAMLQNAETGGGGAPPPAQPGVLTEQDYALLNKVEPEGKAEVDEYEVFSPAQMAKLGKVPALRM